MQDSFANRLIETRKRLGLSQEDLAARIGTKGPAIGRYERGKTQPTLEVATRLADALSVSLDYLTGRTNVEPDPTTRARIEAHTLRMRLVIRFLIERPISFFTALYHISNRHIAALLLRNKSKICPYYTIHYFIHKICYPTGMRRST